MVTISSVSGSNVMLFIYEGKLFEIAKIAIVNVVKYGCFA